MMMIPAVLAAAFAAASTAPPIRVEVKSLPGYNKPLPSKFYSGFVDVGLPPSGKGTMYMHYVAWESEHDPANAPTVFWYNGGPGASSLFGLFGELGPLFLDIRSQSTPEYNKTGIPTPIYNPNTWTKKFNVIALDSPAPVGFSYCTEFGPAGKGTSCGPWKDTEVFKANHKAVTSIMKNAFPEWLKNDLFITGESYAGVYIPGLVDQLLDDMQGLNLKGFAVGDGCVGTDINCMNMQAPVITYPGYWAGPWYDVLFFGGHGQISNTLYRKIINQCPEEALRSNNLTDVCHGYIKEMKAQIGGFFVYDLYDDCPTNAIKGLGSVREDYACSGTALADYLGRSDVRVALQVPVDDYYFNADDGLGFNYTLNVKDVRPIYARAAKAGLRILTFEGDADGSGLSSYGLQDIYRNLWPAAGYKLTEAWRPWTVDGKKLMGGYAMEWNNRQMSHLTIRGSGHMVPLDRPVQSLSLIQAFVFDHEFPKYN